MVGPRVAFSLLIVSGERLLLLLVPLRLVGGFIGCRWCGRGGVSSGERVGLEAGVYCCVSAWEGSRVR